MSPLKGTHIQRDAPDVAGGGVYPLPFGSVLVRLASEDKPHRNIARWLAGSDWSINVGAHEILSKTTNATASHGQTFWSPPAKSGVYLFELNQDDDEANWITNDPGPSIRIPPCEML